jgi:hypothetical protein
MQVALLRGPLGEIQRFLLNSAIDHETYLARSAAEDASEVLPPPPRLSASESEGETDVSESGVAGPSPDHRRQEGTKNRRVRRGKTQGEVVE